MKGRAIRRVFKRCHSPRVLDPMADPTGSVRLVGKVIRVGADAEEGGRHGKRS